MTRVLPVTCVAASEAYLVNNTCPVCGDNTGRLDAIHARDGEEEHVCLNTDCGAQWGMEINANPKLITYVFDENEEEVDFQD